MITILQIFVAKVLDLNASLDIDSKSRKDIAAGVGIRMMLLAPLFLSMLRKAAVVAVLCAPVTTQ